MQSFGFQCDESRTILENLMFEIEHKSDAQCQVMNLRWHHSHKQDEYEGTPPHIPAEIPRISKSELAKRSTPTHIII